MIYLTAIFLLVIAPMSGLNTILTDIFLFQLRLDYLLLP